MNREIDHSEVWIQGDRHTQSIKTAEEEFGSFVPEDIDVLYVEDAGNVDVQASFWVILKNPTWMISAIIVGILVLLGRLITTSRVTATALITAETFQEKYDVDLKYTDRNDLDRVDNQGIVLSVISWGWFGYWILQLSRFPWEQTGILIGLFAIVFFLVITSILYIGIFYILIDPYREESMARDIVEFIENSGSSKVAIIAGHAHVDAIASILEDYDIKVYTNHDQSLISWIFSRISIGLYKISKSF